MKTFLEILLFVIVIVILFYLTIHFAQRIIAPVTQQDQLNSVCVNGKCFQVEIAKTDVEREKGLMNITQLDKNKGMLFIFDKEGIYPFWMRNTLIPLDMIWIDGNNKIVFIAENVQPCKSFVCPLTAPIAKAKYVLEVNGGLCKEFNLKVGDSVDINIK